MDNDADIDDNDDYDDDDNDDYDDADDDENEDHDDAECKLDGCEAHPPSSFKASLTLFHPVSNEHFTTNHYLQLLPATAFYTSVAFIMCVHASKCKTDSVMSEFLCEDLKVTNDKMLKY